MVKHPDNARRRPDRSVRLFPDPEGITRKLPQSTLPGLSRPSGSSARLIARIRSSSTGSLTPRQQPALQPADAVLGRDRAAVADDDGVDDGVHLAPSGRGRRPCRRPTGWVRLKWMLPSPRWPNGTGRAARHQAARPPPSPRPMKSGTRGERHRDVVLDRAALGLLRLGHALRAGARGLALGVEAAAIAASRDQAALHRLGQQRPRIRPRSSAVGARGQLEQHVPGMRAGQRIAACPGCGEHEVDADARPSARSW